MRAQERATDHVAFGERVDRPLAVNLKRKHWAGAERTAAERCKSVFLQQMAAAERKVHAGGAAAEAGGSAAHKAGQGQGGKAGRRQHQARQQVVKAPKLQVGRVTTQPACAFKCNARRGLWAVWLCCKVDHLL